MTQAVIEELELINVNEQYGKSIVQMTPGARAGLLHAVQEQRSVGQIGEAASAYVTGAVIGALVFGWLTDRFGRRTVFYATLIVYLAGVLLTATSWNFLSFALFRVITGLGIGGEYAAINSAIDELIPARFRGRIDIIVNGSFWLGAALGQFQLRPALEQLEQLAQRLEQLAQRLG